MTCMCGDHYCSSCGPAQGNAKCFVCGAWSADGGCEDPKKCEAELALHDESAMIEQLEEEARLAEEYWQGERQRN